MPTALTFVFVYVLILGFFLPLDFRDHHVFDGLFSGTTTSGGDTGAHHYPAQYLIQELLPHGKLTGWAPGWYAGMPMLTFYFPLPFLVIAILDWFLPYEIAFKLGTVLGVFLLPLTVYGLGRLLRIRRPYPTVAAAFAAAFLFMEHSGTGLYSIYGGNILSTLAGEFGYMISFALMALFLGTMYRGMKNPQVNMLFVANCLLLMSLALSHIVTTIILVFTVPGLLLPFLFEIRKKGVLAVLEPLAYLVAVGLIGFCLTAFWSLPFAANMKWTAGMEWDQLAWLGGPFPLWAQITLTVWGTIGLVATISLGIYASRTGRRVITFAGSTLAVTLAVMALIMLPLLSTHLIPRTWQFLTVFILGIIGMAYAVARGERRLLPLAWMTFIAIVMYAVLPDGKALWNGRLLSFWYFSFYLWAAYAVTWFLRLFMTFLWDLLGVRTHVTRRAYVPIMALLIVIITGATSTVAGGWIQWNYLGYEKKGAWPEYRAILDAIDTLPKNSRVMIEHGDKINEFGTPRAFEIIPYWTQADTMEGTLMEASYTAPFHFINQRELSEQPSNAILGVAYPPSVNVELGITHLQLMNIPYFLAFENSEGGEQVIPGCDADPRAKLIDTFGVFRLYEIQDTSGYVEIMKNQPVRVAIGAGIEWRDMAVEWYKNPNALDTPLVMDNGEEALQQFASVSIERSTYPPKEPIVTEGEVTNVVFENERLSFETTAIGVPHWIKISYFPNWHVKGAEGPFLASPSFMMVIPTEQHVELYYGRTWANTVGQILETLAWALLLSLVIWRIVVRVRSRRPLPEGAGVVDGAGAVEGAGPVPPPLPELEWEDEVQDEWVGAGEREDIPDYEDDSPRR